MFTFLRVLKYSFEDIGRNVGLSFMTVFILVLMLLSVNALWVIKVLTKEAVNSVRQQIDVSVYFVPETIDKNVNEIKTYISMFPEVMNIDLLSREQVLQQFQAKHVGNKEILDALRELGGNPFGPTLIIKTREPKDYKKIIESLTVPEYDHLIEAKSFEDHEGAIDRIQNITARVERIGLGLAVLFVVIAFLIIFNTIRVSIATHRVEISIKRLVGASSWFIRGPYLLESLFFTLVSMGITVGLIFLALRWLNPYLSVIFADSFSLTNYYASNMLWLFGIQAVAALLLTVVSSSLAMRKQLKV